MQQENASYPAQSDYPLWHYQPIRLLKGEMENPVDVINAFFSGYTLPQARRHFKEMLEDAMCNVEMYSINYLTLYDSIEKLIEAAWLIKERETEGNRSVISQAAGKGIHTFIQLLEITIRPERIFLLSGGESTAVDLLIVVADNSGKPFSYYGTLIEALSYGSNLSFSLHDSSSFKQHIGEGHPFWLSCCTENKQVYCSVSTPFPVPSKEKRKALLERMRTVFFTGMARSRSFLESAHANRLHGDSSINLFLLHQSVELVFRALVLSLTGREIKEHSIAILSKHLRRCAPDLYSFFPNDTGEEKALLSLLEAAYCKGRYDESFSPGNEKLNLLFKRVETLHDIAGKYITNILDAITKNGEEAPLG